MKKIDYERKKWDKIIDNLNKFKGFLGQDYMKNINYLVEEKNSQSESRFCWYATCISGGYWQRTKCFLTDNDEWNMIQSTYLSAKSFAYFKKLYTLNVGEIVNLKLTLDTEEEQAAKAIAVDCLDYLSDGFSDSILANLYFDNREIAKEKIEQLPNKDQFIYGESWTYTEKEFLKGIFEGILYRDEKKFNDELLKRVKKYRRNMWDYAVVIDYLSIGLIKTAKKYGIKSDLNIIEMPDCFFEPVDTEKLLTLKIPLQDEIEEAIRKHMEF